MEQRRRLVVIGAAVVGVTGLILLAANFDFLRVVVALVSTLAGAGGGWTAGIGYARAGGDEMIPPNAQKVR
jgi:glycine/D-amino acid oxidase-like deaminating enzyme